MFVYSALPGGMVFYCMQWHGLLAGRLCAGLVMPARCIAPCESITLLARVVRWISQFTRQCIVLSRALDGSWLNLSLR